MTSSFLFSPFRSTEPGKGRFILPQKRKRKINYSAKYMRRRFKRLRVEMKEMRKEQESIKEVQWQVRAKFKAVEEECEQLRKETNQIIRQSASTHIRLALMFNILKAREQCNFAKAAQLTQLLREIVARSGV